MPDLHRPVGGAYRDQDLRPRVTRLRSRINNNNNRGIVSAGRSGVIRTLDPHVPNVVRYQTALHSVTSGASIEQHF